MMRLNTFQFLMRRWARIHPYNAGQVMRISGAPDRVRWKAAAEAVIGELGLGVPRFAADEDSVHFEPPAEVAIEESGQDLEGFFNDELNRPFAAGDLPIRFCILPASDQAGTPSHYFAAVYDHWIGDSRAMRDLMQRIFDRYQHPESESPRLPRLSYEAPEFRRLFKKALGPLPNAPRAIVESLRNLWHHRNAYRLNMSEPTDLNSRFVYRELQEGLIQRLHAFAKARRASVNDLFIAVIGQAVGAYTAPLRHKPKKKRLLHFTRNQVGIGTIVDIRDQADQPLDRVFNLYLSSYSVIMRDPEQRPMEKLLRQVSRRTSRLKKSSATVKSFCAMDMARYWYGKYGMPRFQASLFNKNVPLLAGISNVNMTRSWADPAESAPGVPQIMDYLRISPVGPLIPVVFTLTTIQGRLSLCVTYRTIAISEGELTALVEDFVGRLERFTQA
jgi:hypothetical protein